METAIRTAGETAVYTAADTAFLTVDQAAVRIALYLHIRYISWGINCSGAKFEVFLYGLFRKKKQFATSPCKQPHLFYTYFPNRETTQNTPESFPTRFSNNN